MTTTVFYGVSISSIYKPHENSESSLRRSSMQLYKEEASSQGKEEVVLALLVETDDVASIIVDKPNGNEAIDLEYLP